MLNEQDLQVRGTLTRAIAELGHAPSLEALSARLQRAPTEVEDALQRLQDQHALLLHPGTCRPWIVHPFALTASACWVQTSGHGYWAPCLYCAFGIVAALECEAVVSTRIAGEADAVTYTLDGVTAPKSDAVFHLSIPVEHWWDNVVAACASFQPFCSADDIDPWCARHAMPRGETMTVPALWAFARDWYGDYLKVPWRKRSLEETRALFAKHGLTSKFWQI